MESNDKGPGCLNLAFNKLPSFWPHPPCSLLLPAYVVTSPDGVIFLILWLLWSETNILSFASIAIPHGCLKEASVPFASEYSYDPFPAKSEEVAAPVPGSKVNFLILWWLWSVTNKFPLLSKAIPEICPNWVSVLLPVESPQSPFPETKVTLPEVSIFEILLLPSSATYILPELSKTRKAGLANPTSNLEPSSLLWAQSPFPAQVVTFPERSIFLIKLLSTSAMYKFPDESKVDPLGYLNLASVPIPSLDPVWPDPAKVDTWFNSKIS